MSLDLKHEHCHTMDDEKKYELLDQTIEDYNRNEDNLIQILHMAQALFGYLSTDVQKYVAEKVDIPFSKVSGVVSFYTFFSSSQKGKYNICVCLGTACYVRGGNKILEKLKEILEIDIGETTEDGKFSLEVMRCIGACGLAPAISINDKVYRQVNSNKLMQIIAEYK